MKLISCKYCNHKHQCSRMSNADRAVLAGKASGKARQPAVKIRKGGDPSVFVPMGRP
jgi:hypothetical protein